MKDKNKKPELLFSTEFEDSTFFKAMKEYEKIWEEDGDKIIETMEIISGLRFKQEEVTVIIHDGISFSGSDVLPMKLRYSYPQIIKKGTLIHELGHRLIEQLREKPADIDEHGVLFLILYDIWVELYGTDFAEQMVNTEKLRKGHYDYEQAWNQALSLSQTERKDSFDLIRKLNCL